jgi:hypothetical protein
MRSIRAGFQSVPTWVLVVAWVVLYVVATAIAGPLSPLRAPAKSITRMGAGTGSG